MASQYKKVASPAFLLYLVCTSAFLASVTQNIYSPIVPLLRDSFQVPFHFITFSVSIFMFVLAMMQIVYGPLIDAKGGKRVLMPSIFLSMIGALGCALTSNFTLFLVFRVVQAAGIAAIPLVASTTISDLFNGTARGNAMSTYQTMLALAPAISPVVGAFIGEQAGYRGIFLFLVIISIILFVMNLKYFPQRTEHRTVHAAGSSSHRYMSVFKNKWGQAIMAIGFVHYFIYFAFLVSLPILLTDYYHLGLGLIGLLYLPTAVSTMLGSRLYKTVQQKMEQRKLLFLGSLLTAGCVVLFAVTIYDSLVLLTVSSILYGVCSGLTMPTHTTLLANEFDENRGTAMGVYNLVRYMGMAAGPMVSSVLLLTLNNLWLFVLFGVSFAIIVIVLAIRVYGKVDVSPS
ncbi:MFS transporter [Paenibacillus profundus]|uniref:MFS transporter n=1 Tax=Paenibacillus profundus TaxID=1173085 RepID=A0ABS8YG62_9BACL|nr:MFS transporter [Paenibacillus profundus]MCE5170771.1 MFS transporter [Paenibacillus profundus]